MTKGNYVPEEEEELRLPPELKDRLAKLVLRLQREQSSVTDNSDAVETTKELQDAVDNIEKQLERLNFKCAALEAQNILVSVQQLDMLARGTAWILSLTALFLYCRLALGITSILHSALVSKPDDTENVCKTTMVSFVLSLLLQVLINVVLRGALLILPYFYNRHTHGSVHRRFQVFAIAFIVIFRVRLCRWREQTFLRPIKTASLPSAESNARNDDAGESKPMSEVDLYGESITEDALWEANYEVSARFLYISILRLRGLWTKTAQYLSSRADFMPSSYVRELKRLQDEAPATPWKEVEPLLPPAAVGALTDIDPTPLASASIGQVHTARLKATGEKVAIKVQHPHARSLILDDLWSLAVILRIVSWMEPDYEFLEILMREWAKEATKELDFSIEVSNLKDAKTAIELRWNTPQTVQFTASSSECPSSLPFQVEIPVPFENFCNDRVLVMTFCEGVRVDEFDKLQTWGLPRYAVMNAVAQVFAHMMYTTGIFNGDPHPGNLFVRPGTIRSKSDGLTLVLLDWGLAKRLTESKRLAFCELVYAAATFDYGLMIDAQKHIGLQMKRENASYDMENLRFFLRDLAPSKLSRKRIKSKLRNDEAYRNTLKKEEQVPMKSKAYPGEFFFFVRVNELLHGLGSKFDVAMEYLDVLRPYAELGIRQSKFYRDPVVSSPMTLNGTQPSCIDSSLEAKLRSCFEELEKEGNLAGAQFFALDDQGRTVADVVGGTLGGLKSGIPMDSHSLVLGFSCTKAIAATMAHIMVTEGYLTYDEPLAQSVWPAFCPTEKPPPGLENALDLPLDEVRKRWYWKRQISLWHVLTHQAAMWNALPPKTSVKTLGSCEACVAAFEYNDQYPEDTLLPIYEPGTKSEYHFLSFGWLVAGALCRAYAKKHRLEFVSFEAVYKAVLYPKLSESTKKSGFRPCGGGGGYRLANTVTDDISASKLLQKRRESLAIGEKDNSNEQIFEKLKGYRGKEFLLDPRIWNCSECIDANVPAAGGRFSAAGLAHFYHDLGSGRILNKAIVADVSSVLVQGTGALQGATAVTANADEQRTSLGCGYQLIRFDGDDEKSPSAFGHAGVGGSIGFYHKRTGFSVGLMLNKADGGREITIRVLKVFGDHYQL